MVGRVELWSLGELRAAWRKLLALARHSGALRAGL